MYTQNRPRRGSPFRSARKTSGHAASGFSGRPASSSHQPSKYRGRGGARPTPYYKRGAKAGGGNGGGRRFSTFDVSRYINKNPAQTAPEEAYQNKHAFTDFGFQQPLIAAIEKAKLTTPTPIQDQIIPYILNERDVVGLANTGTGKTAAFLLPLISRALVNDKSEVLILTPTRELALQIEQELRKLSDGMRLFSTTCIGGANMWQQISRLKRKNNFVIGTPGRILDLIKRKAIKPSYFSTVVLDEADRMLDMGFIQPIKDILHDMPATRNTLCFSATMSPNIERLVHEFLKDPLTITVKKKDITGLIEQDVVRYTPHDKFTILADLLLQPDFKRVLVFGSMKHSVEKLSLELNERGIRADSIHGNKSQGQRQRALKRFKEGGAQVLVATDVAARGLHIDHVSHVINYDLPATYEDYVHRIGRTGRGVHSGKALTFVR